MAQDLTNRVAIVTGAGRRTGIGYAIARNLAERGANVVITDLCRRPQQAAEEHARAELNSIAGEIHGLAIEADITQPDDIAILIERTLETYDQIDIFVNNAGICITKPLLETSLAEWDLTQRVNLQSVFLCGNAAARQMIKQGNGGSIINMSSISGKEGWPNFGSYTASKFAVIGLTQVLARELAAHNIRVNAVCPGLVDTGLNAQIVGELATIRHGDAAQIEDDQLKRVPLGRYATPDDVAQTVGFLVSPAAAYITGQAWNVCGGLMVGR